MEKDKLQQKLTAAEAEIQRLNQEAASKARDARRAEFHNYCSSDEIKARIVADMRPAVVEFMLAIDGDDVEIEYSQGEQQVKKTRIDIFKDLLAAIPKQVDCTEFASRDRASAAGSEEDKYHKIGADIAATVNRK